MNNVVIEKAERIENLMNLFGPSIEVHFILNNVKCIIYFSENKNNKAIYGGYIYQFDKDGKQIGEITGKETREVSNYLKKQYNTGNIK